MKKKIDKKKIFVSVVIFLLLAFMIAIIMEKTPMPGFENLKTIFTVFLIIGAGCLAIMFAFITSIINPDFIYDDKEYKEYPEEFKKIYKYLEEKDLSRIEEVKFEAQKYSKIRTFSFILLTVSIIHLVSFFGYNVGTISSLPFIILFFALAGILLTNKETVQGKWEYEKVFKREIIPELIKQINPSLEYNVTYPVQQKKYLQFYADSTFLLNEYSYKIDTEDYIEGNLDDTMAASIVDINVRNVDPNLVGVDKVIGEFTGLFGVFYDKAIKDDIDLRIRTISEVEDYKMNSFQTGFDKFDKKYKVYDVYGNIVERLTYDGMFYDLYNIHDKYGTYPEIVIKGKYIYIRTYGEKLFEPNLYDKSRGFKPLYEYYVQLKTVLEVSEIVRKYMENL